MRPPAAPSTAAALGLTISSVKLSNGLRVVVVTDPRAAEVQVTTRYQVGAIDDPAAHGGMAHLVEHLMFVHVVDGQSLAKRLAAVATHFNAVTTHDATFYVSRAHPTKLRELLAIEALRLRSRCTGISEAEFERERDVVLNELRLRESAMDVLAALGRALFDPDHPYGRRVGGSFETVAAITKQQACAFADAHYSVGKAVLVVSGHLPAAQVEAALAADLARVEETAFATPAVVPRSPFTMRAVEAAVPLDGDGLVVVWKLPSNPKLRAKYRALVAAAAELASTQIRGSVAPIEPGGERANLIGLVLAAGDGESDRELVNAAAHGARWLPAIFERQGVREIDQLGFNRTKHGAMYRLFSVLDDASARDPLLATFVADGRDPGVVLRAQIQGLQELTRDEAIALSRDQLDFDAAKVITLKAAKKQAGPRLTLTSSIAQVEDHQAPIDPSDAHRPATTTVTTQLDGIKTRRLANGLEVILLPTAAAPIVDMRLVFRAGTADERSTKRGEAMLAARALTFDERHVKDLLGFATAGGKLGVDVDFDRTTFSAHGMATQLHFLLAGLRRIVRDGTYEHRIDWFTRAIKRAHRYDGAGTEAWRSAVFGADHPYARAGLLRHAQVDLNQADAGEFRAAHYTPDNATLVIAGRFDPDVVDRWIDYLFADWTGRAVARAAPPTSFKPAAFAVLDETSHIDLALVFPVTIAEHATRLVAAQMLAELTSGVRDQLGVSYDASSQLTEQRLSASYTVTMQVDAERAPAATKLVAERIARLHADPEFAARTFVAARQRVLAQLASVGDSATGIASRVEHDVELGRDVIVQREVVGLVRELTIDNMKSALADLTLSRAVIAMRGPAAIKQAFAALGREPQYVAAPRSADDEDDDDEEEVGEPEPRQIDNDIPELVDPLTSPSSPYRVAFTLAAGASFATMERFVGTARKNTAYSGPSISAAFGYRRRRSSLRVGVQVGAAMLSGTTTGADPRDVGFSSLDVGPFFQARLHGPFWFGGAAALRFEEDPAVHTGGQLGLQLGLDLTPIKYGWLVLLARYDHVRMPEASYGALTVAAALRR